MKRLAPHLRLGRLGERLAARELRRLGLVVLERNFSEVGVGEIDLICRDGQVLVFVEVKTRSAGQWARPADAVTRSKRKKIKLTANHWRSKYRLKSATWRFDVVEVIVPRGFMAFFRARFFVHSSTRIT